METCFKRFIPIILTTILFLSSISMGMEVSLPPPEGSYKILMLLPFGSESHRNCFLPLIEVLAERGHEIVVLSGLQPKSKNPKVKEINHGVEVLKSDLSMFEIRETDSTKGFSYFKYILPKLAREMYDEPSVKELYQRRDEFDIMIIDNLFNEPAYPFLVNKKYIAIDPVGISPTPSAILGNVLNPSFVPALTVDFLRPYSFFQRLFNLGSHLVLPFYWRHYEIIPLVQKEISARFPDMPPLLEIERGLSLVLMNTHFSLDAPYPLLPSQVEVGCMHCKMGNKLPQDLLSWIEDAGTNGVVYFSLGTVCKGKTIPQKYKVILIEAFAKLKQRIIWKFEEEFEGLPNNVIIRSWLPQQDILAHPNVKLFITHGGLLSMQEAVFHETPLLALPVFGDQEKNAEKIVNKGYGQYILWEELTLDILIHKIEEIIANTKYIETIHSVSVSFRDQMSSPIEKAVWWTEYMIRHKGAPQLRSPGADLSWVEFLMIDVIVMIHLIIFITYWLVKKALNILFSKKTELKRKYNKKNQ